MRRVLALSISLTALCGALAAHAESPPSPSDTASMPDVAGTSAANAVAGVVVVANRTATPADKIGQSFTVLTLPELKADQEMVVSDVLARTPGVAVSRSGGVGEPTGISIRGAPSGQTMVLIDGVKLTDPSATDGGFSLENLLTGDTSRIEILRGPQSTLYGSQAIGGVVNIVTADPTKPFEGDAQLEGGSYNTVYAKAGVGGHDGPVTWRLAADSYSTTGISAFDQHRGGKEADGYDSQGVSGRFSYAFSPEVSLDLRGAFMNSRSAFDGFSNPTFSFGDDPEYGTAQEGLAYAGLNVDLLGGRLKNRLAMQYTSTQRDQFDPTFPPEPRTFDGFGNEWRAEYQGVFAIAQGWQAVFGAEHEQSNVSIATPQSNDPASPSYFPPGSPPISAGVHIDSGYGQIQAEVIPGLTLTGGARYDVHSNFGGHVTGQASAAWSLNGGDTVLRASWGQGFNAPSLYQLYSQYGVANLKPEQADGWDIGAEQHFWDRRIDLQATYFRRDTSDLIEFVFCSNVDPVCIRNPTLFGHYANVDRAFAQGAELSGAIRPVDGLEVTANYTYTEATDRTTGAVLARVPRHTANAEVSYVWPFKLTTAAAIRYASDSFDDAANTHRLRAYTLVDLRASYPLTRNLELYGRIENVGGAVYETVYRYGTLGRAVYAGVRATF